MDALAPGRGFAELTAGARGPWAGPAVAFARGELGAHLTPGLSLFGYGEATLGGALPGWQAGLGARVRW